MMCTRLKFRTASIKLFRAVTKTPYRSVGTSSAGGTHAGAGFLNRWKVYAGSKRLLLATGVAVVSVSTVAYCRENVTEDKKIATARRLLEYYSSEKNDIQERTICAFLSTVNDFVRKTESQKLDTEKKISIAKDILEDLGVSLESRKKELIDELRTYWNEKEKGIEQPEDRLINDAIHGSIELSPLLYQIINTPEFHRLKDVRQLGAAHYVYPGANHTRFDHSIGVCHLAGVFAKSLKEKLTKDAELISISDTEERKLYSFEDEEIMCVQIAGLCHDLGHGPLSHMFERKVVEFLELKNFKKHNRHEDLSVNIFKKMLKDNPKVLAEFIDEGLRKKHVKLVEEMINPPEPKDRTDPDRRFLYEIVANKVTGIDVDKWDYYARDCHYLGVEQDFQWRRCMLLARIVKAPSDYEGAGKLRVAFRGKELDNIYGMFRTRAVLHQKAYQHKTIQAVEKMIADALLQVQDIHLIRIDREVKSIKEAVELASHEDPTKRDLKWYLALTDSIVGTIMCADGGSSDLCKRLDKAQELLTRVKERDLYSCLVRIPIPRNTSRCDSHMDNLQCKVCDKFDANLEAVKELSDKDDSFKDVILKDLQHIKHDEIWVEVVKFKHSSEKDNDPAKQVVFYRKKSSRSKLPEAIPRGVLQPSKLVVPLAFAEYDLRVYDTRKKINRKQNDRDQLIKATRAALNGRANKIKSN